MDKHRLYRLATWSLLALNLVLVAFLFLRPGPQKPAPEKLIDLLELTDEQQGKFRELARAHRGEMRSVNDRQRQLLRDYFAGLHEHPERDSFPLPPAMLDLQEAKITGTYAHLREVRSLLTPAQLELYPEFTRRALRRILMDNRADPKRRPSPGRKDQ